MLQGQKPPDALEVDRKSKLENITHGCGLSVGWLPLLGGSSSKKQLGEGFYSFTDFPAGASPEVIGGPVKNHRKLTGLWNLGEIHSPLGEKKKGG